MAIAPDVDGVRTAELVAARLLPRGRLRAGQVVGDDISFTGDTYELLELNTAQAIAFIFRLVGSHGSVGQRAKRLASFAASGQKEVMAFLTTHSTLGSQFAERLGLSDEACRAIKQGYEAWDGKGVPAGLAGKQISLASRLVHFASPIEVFDRRRGVDAASMRLAPFLDEDVVGSSTRWLPTPS